MNLNLSLFYLFFHAFPFSYLKYLYALEEKKLKLKYFSYVSLFFHCENPVGKGKPWETDILKSFIQVISTQ